MAESLFCRLQKLNKEAVPGPWFLVVNDLIGGKSVSTVDVPMSQIEPQKSLVPADMLNSDAEGALIVECRNSLPAVLNLIEAARHIEILHDLEPDLTASAADLTGRHTPDCPGCRFMEALAVFAEES